MAKARLSAWEVKNYGHSVENIVDNSTDDELEEFVDENPILKEYICKFHDLQSDVDEYGISETMWCNRYLFEGLYITDDGDLYDLDGATATLWENYTGTTYISELSQEKQHIIRLIITGYVYTELKDYTEQEKQDAIESAMNERLCNITDAEIVRDLLASAGIY